MSMVEPPLCSLRPVTDRLPLARMFALKPIRRAGDAALRDGAGLHGSAMMSRPIESIGRG
jgi:hypothetical protein